MFCFCYVFSGHHNSPNCFFFCYLWTFLGKIVEWFPLPSPCIEFKFVFLLNKLPPKVLEHCLPRYSTHIQNFIKFYDICFNLLISNNYSISSFPQIFYEGCWKVPFPQNWPKEPNRIAFNPFFVSCLCLAAYQNCYELFNAEI